MLVVHTILLMGFGLNILGDPDINHLLTITLLSILLCSAWITGIVYKNTALSILDASFTLNLSGWTIYNRHASNGDSSNGQTALVCTSTGVTFSTYSCLLPYILTFTSSPHGCTYTSRETKSRGETEG